MAMTLGDQYGSVNHILQQYSKKLRQILLLLKLNDSSYAACPNINSDEHDFCTNYIKLTIPMDRGPLRM